LCLSYFYFLFQLSIFTFHFVSSFAYLIVLLFFFVHSFVLSLVCSFVCLFISPFTFHFPVSRFAGFRLLFRLVIPVWSKIMEWTFLFSLALRRQIYRLRRHSFRKKLLSGSSEIIWDTCVAEKCTFHLNWNAHHFTAICTVKSTISNHGNRNWRKVKIMEMKSFLNRPNLGLRWLKCSGKDSQW
jgi:hypothetical protein